MICYHGSDVVVDNPKILEAKRPLDFGGGFYVTTSRTQAEQWATKVAYRNNSRYKFINRYECDIEKMARELSVARFEKADERWLDFICAHRSGNPMGEYDVVIGPVADDKVYRVVVEYENGDVDKDTALKKLKTESLCDQIAFRTEKALNYLTYIDAEEI